MFFDWTFPGAFIDRRTLRNSTLSPLLTFFLSSFLRGRKKEEVGRSEDEGSAIVERRRVLPMKDGKWMRNLDVNIT